MTKAARCILVQLLAVAVWAADWPMPGGNPQRNGWAGSEHRITKANVSSLRLLYKYQTDNHSDGANALTPPIVNGNLITYRGFKEMLLFAGSADKVFSVDADLNRLLWERSLRNQEEKATAEGSVTAACPGGLSAPVVMAGSSSSSLHFAALARRRPAATAPGGVPPRPPSPYLPPLTQSVYPLLPSTLTELDALYAVSSDGELHVLNSSTGEDLIPPVPFLPPRAKVTSLNIRDNVVYATTADNCDGYRDALFSMNLLSASKQVHSFVAPRGGFRGTDVTAIGNDGTIYVQLAYAPDKRPGRYQETVVALTPGDLRVKDYFAIGKRPADASADGERGITPVVFSFPGRDLVLAGGRDGRLYLLDSRSLGGADHRTPLYTSDVVGRDSKRCSGSGFRGGFSTWFDVDSGKRHIYVPVAGPRAAGKRSQSSDGQAENGSVLAFDLAGDSEHPQLAPIWTSREVVSPAPVVIANGMVFALSTGARACTSKRGKRTSDVDTTMPQVGPAMLYVFDALSGKQLYASGDTGAKVSGSTGLAMANGRAYFTAQDNAVYCFGIPGQQSQLVEQ